MGQNPHRTKWIRICQTASAPTGQRPGRYEQISLNLTLGCGSRLCSDSPVRTRPHTLSWGERYGHLLAFLRSLSCSYSREPVSLASFYLFVHSCFFPSVSLERVTGSPTFLSLPSNVNPPPSEYLQRVISGIECRRLRRVEFLSLLLHSFAI